MPENLGKVISVISTPDLSAAASQYIGVVLDATGKAAVPGNGARILGVLLNSPAAGQAASIQLDGVAQVRAGAAVTSGDLLQVDASGQFITFAPGAGKYCVGVALETASGVGIRFSAVLKQYGLA